MIIKTTIILILIIISQSAGKNWYSPYEITGGSVTIIPQNNIGKVNILFDTSFDSKLYLDILGANSFGINSGDNDFKFEMTATQVTTQKFNLNYIFASNSTFTKFVASYLFFNTKKITNGLGVSYLNYDLPGSTGGPIQQWSASLGIRPSNQVRCLFLSSLSGILNSPNLSFNIFLYENNNGELFIKFIFLETKIQKVGLTILIINSQLNSNYNISHNIGFIQYSEGIGYINFPLSNDQKTTNFMSGLNGVKIDKNTSPYFMYNYDSIQKIGSVSYINITYLNFRIWKCAPKTFYDLTDDSCLQKCVDGKFVNNQTENCDFCLYHCQTCKFLTNCSTCLSSNFRKLNQDTALCVCMQKYFDDGINSKCKNCIDGCSICTNQLTCQKCLTTKKTYNFFGISQQLSYILIPSLQCILCPEKMKNCLTCTDADKCLTCSHSNFTLTPDQSGCKCDEIRQYFQQLDRCVICSQIIRGCITCSSNNTCQSCITPNNTIGLNNQQCNCNTASQYFPLNQKCILCQQLILGCTQCVTTQTCQIYGNICVCIDGYYLSQSQCLPCEDSFLTCKNSPTNCLTCNNTALRIFNQNKCECIQPFSDCRVSEKPTCISKTCSFLTKIELKILELIKNPMNNSLTMTVSIYPIIEDFNQPMFTQIFNIGSLLNSNLSYSYSNGLMTINIDYDKNLQMHQEKITLNLTQMNKWYFDLAPNVQMNYIITATNNLASNAYSPNIYEKRLILNQITLGVTIFGVIIYVIGLWGAKIIVSQMISVVQIAFMSLFIVNRSDPLVNSLIYLRYSLGINNLFQTNQQQTPNRLFFIGFTSSAFANINIMIVILIIPGILSFLFYRIHLTSTKYKKSMQIYWKKALGQWMLTAFLLIMYNFSSSLIGFIMFTHPNGYQFYVSIVFLIIMSSLLGILIWIFIKKSKVWMGQYKSNFDQNTFSEYYYLIPITQRFLIGIILTSASITFISAIICICIVAISLLAVAIKRPFISKSQNIRSIITNIYSILILIMYILISSNGPSTGQSNLTYLPYAIVGVVLVNILTATGFIIYSFYNHFKKIKLQTNSKIQTQEQQKLQMQLNKQMQIIKKKARQNKPIRLNEARNKKTQAQQILDSVEIQLNENLV